MSTYTAFGAVDRMGRWGMLAAATLTAIPHLAFAQASAPSPAACASLLQLQVPGVALTVTKAEWVPAGMPPGRPAGGLEAARWQSGCPLTAASMRSLTVGPVWAGWPTELDLPWRCPKRGTIVFCFRVVVG